MPTIIIWVSGAAALALIVVIAKKTRPGGGRIARWVSVLGSGLLAFQSARMAAGLAFGVFFMCCGTILVTTATVSIARWGFHDRHTREQSGERLARGTDSRGAEEH